VFYNFLINKDPKSKAQHCLVFFYIFELLFTSIY